MPPMSFDNDPSALTSSLKETFARNSKAVDEYVEKQMARADAAAEAHAELVARHQDEINTLAKTLAAVQSERGLKDSVSEGGIAKRREELLVLQQEVKRDIEKLQKQQEEKESEVQGLLEKETRQKSLAEKNRKKKEEIEEMKKTTVDDLTTGIVNYKRLGLDFEKAEDRRMRVRFTLLDPSDPRRPFSFVLDVNDEDKYQVEDCQPLIDSSEMTDLLDRLNATNDVMSFVNRMRKAFIGTL